MVGGKAKLAGIFIIKCGFWLNTSRTDKRHYFFKNTAFWQRQNYLFVRTHN
jgi:hypothetical protein